jgi:hypothetical protein
MSRGAALEQEFQFCNSFPRNKAYDRLGYQLLKFLIDEPVAILDKIVRNCNLAVVLNKFTTKLKTKHVHPSSISRVTKAQAEFELKLMYPA